MPEKHSSPDWFARGAAAVGIVLSILGLGLTYSNYRWQKEIYQENTAERILVRVGVSRVVNDPEPFSFKPKGEVGVEVVNIGLRSLYIKRVELQIGNNLFPLYQHDPTKTKEPMKLLEPSEATNYTLSGTSHNTRLCNGQSPMRKRKMSRYKSRRQRRHSPFSTKL